MAKKKKLTPEEEAKIQLDEQKKKDLTLKPVDNTSINAAAPVLSSAPAPNPILGELAKRDADLQAAATERAKERMGSSYIEPVTNKSMADALANANKVQSITPKPKEGIVVNGVTKASDEMLVSKPKTIQDYFNEYKQNAIKEQTNAQKMQQYYALADVLKTLGQMGGGIVGGAIGGSITDNMPNIGEYKASQNYINAFENAKKAKDRLRELDNQQFQLALNMDERTWKQQQAALDRELRSKEQQLARDWEVKFFDYKTKINQAIADKNLAAQQQWQKEMMADKQAYELELAKIRGDYELKARRISAYGGGGRGGKNTPEPHTIVFEDNTTLDMTPSAYNALFARYENSPFGVDDVVNKDNFNEWVRKNKSTVVSFNDVYTKKSQTPATTTNGGTNNTNTPAPAPSGNTDNTKNNKKDKKNKGKKDNEPDLSKWEVK